MDTGGVTTVVVLVSAIVAAYRAHKQKKSERRLVGAEIDEAWALARERLGATATPGQARAIEYEHAGARIVLAQRDDVTRNGEPFVLCVVSHLPKVRGAHLSVEPMSLLGTLAKPFTSTTGDADFDRAFVVTAKPACLARAYFDAATRNALRDSGSPLESGQGFLRLRVVGAPREPQAIVTFASFAERLAERWIEMAAQPLRLAHELGLDVVATTLSLEGTTLLGQAFRHGLSWRLELEVGPHDGEIVLRTDHGEKIELRFPWPETSNEAIGRAFAAKQSELSAAYR